MKNNSKNRLKGKKFLIIVGIIFSGIVTFKGHSQETGLEKSSYRLIQIMVPGSDFHDDGTCFSHFPGYSVYNEEGEHVIRLPACLHSPYMIRMIPGNYNLETIIGGKKVRASFAVSAGEYFQQFSFPDLEEEMQVVEMDY